MEDQIIGGATSQLRTIYVRDSTTGQGKTGLAFGSMTIQYERDGAAALVAVTPVTMTLGTWVSGGWVELGNGYYQFGIPNAAVTAGVAGVDINFRATGAIDVNKRFLIVSEDLRGSTIASRAVPGDGAQVSDVTSARDAVLAKLPAALIGGRIDAIASVVSDKTGFALTAGEHTTVQADANAALVALGVTLARMGYLDKLNITGQVAGSAEVTSIQNNTRIVFPVPEEMERPDAGTQDFIIHLYIYDEVGNMEAPDSAPVLSVANQSGTSRNARLDSVNMAFVETGHYKAIYTMPATDPIEQLLWEVSIVEGGVTRKYGRQTQVVDTSAVDFTASDRTSLNTILSRVPAAVAVNSDMQTLLTTVALNTDIQTLLTRIPSLVALATDIAALKGVGWATESLKAIYDRLVLTLLASAYTAPDNATGTASKVILDKLNAMIQASGGDYQFDVLALALAPTGGVPPTVIEIDNRLSLTHGAGLWGASGGAGANTVSILVRDSVSHIPIPGAVVTLKTALGTVYDQKRTDSNGLAAFTADNGDFLISVSPVVAYTGVTDQALTVNGDESVTINLVLRPITAPPIPGLCTVSGYIQNNGEPLIGATVEAFLKGPNNVAEEALQSNQKNTDTTDSEGYAKLFLIQYSQFTRGGTYHLKVTAASGDIIGNVTVTIPDEDSYNLALLFE
jgi:hypothetical protein